MKYPIISVRDNKTGYLPPQVDQSEAAAIRNFEYAINKPDTLMYSYGADYDLFCIGEFDTDTGLISALDAPALLVSGYSVIKKAEG